MKKKDTQDTQLILPKKVTNTDTKNAHTVIEGILFLENKFITIEDLQNKSGFPLDVVNESIKKLRDLYSKNNHAITILERNENFMIVIKKELVDILRALYPTRVQQKLSRSLLETLAIIAYSQPITKAEIQALRGVNPDNAIKLLIEQSMIKVIGKKAVVGTPNEYGTTQEFLSTFGLSSISELPKLEGHHEAPFI